MMMVPFEFIPLTAALPVVLAAAWTDLRMMRIHNTLVLVGLGIFVVTLPYLDAGEALWRVMIGGISFAVCFALFALGALGGGDSKFFPVIMLFVPIGLWNEFLIVFSLSMAGTMGLFLPARRLMPAGQIRWKSFQPDGRFPMAIAFATAVLGFMAVFALSG